jgi:glycosyltransferase involved in cell wall biosynthesis
MKRLKIAHLNDDFALGGVTKSLEALTADFGASLGEHAIVPVNVNAAPPRVDADVILTHLPPSWRWLVFAWRLRQANPHARLLHVEHSYTREWERLMVASPRRFRLMMRLALRIPDRIVSVSEGQARWLREVAPAASAKIRVVHPWSGRQNLDTVTMRQAGRRLVVGAYGRLTFAKGMDVLVRAAALLDHNRFEILVGGFGPDEASLRREAGALSHLSFFGKVSDVATFLQRCDIVVVPKLAGRPVIVADVDGLPEQVGDAGLIWRPDGPLSLARTIERLAAMDLPTMGAQGRASLAFAEQERFALWQDALTFEAAAEPRFSLTRAAWMQDAGLRPRSAAIPAR